MHQDVYKCQRVTGNGKKHGITMVQHPNNMIVLWYFFVYTKTTLKVRLMPSNKDVSWLNSRLTLIPEKAKQTFNCTFKVSPWPTGEHGGCINRKVGQYLKPRRASYLDNILRHGMKHSAQ